MLNLLIILNDKEWTKIELEFNSNQLPQNMISAILKYKHWSDIQARVLGKLLLKKQLYDFNTCLDLSAVKINSLNKPYVDDNFNFSISHSGQLVACLAGTEGVLGIDIEFMKPQQNQYPIEFFTNEECVYLANSEQQTNAFYKLFTRKEALAKACGEGILMNFSEYSVLNDNVILNGICYYLSTFVYLNQYMISYATSNTAQLLKTELVTINLLTDNL